MEFTIVRRSAFIVVVLIAGVLVGAACSGSSTSTTTTTSKSVSIETPNGQASLSLNGQLPPNWPSGFPIPPGATPAGSGSLGNQASTTLVGVYKTSAAPNTTFDFYENNATLTVSSVKTVGAGSAFVGSLELTQSPTGSVTVAGQGTNTLIVVVLNTAGTSATSTTSSTSSSSTSSSSTSQP